MTSPAPARAVAPANQVARSPQASPRRDPQVARPTPQPELAHAHPISERHELLREQQALLGALNDALDLQDAAALRTLLARYDAVQPEDPMRLAEGYERVADCLEADETTAYAADDGVERASVRANAQRYYDEARASSVRRYVRRYCLEPSQRN